MFIIVAPPPLGGTTMINMAPLWVVNLAPPLGAYFFRRGRRAMRVALHGDGEEEEEEGEGREGGR